MNTYQILDIWSILTLKLAKMHETLRSSFKLQKENVEWQRITSDSVNNTFFSIYAKFYYEEGSFTPKSCDVRIQNYTGSITYGISEVESEIKFIFDKDVKEYVFLFTIKLKPLFANEEFSQNNLKIVDLSYDGIYDEKINNVPNNFSDNHLMFIDLVYENYHICDLDSKTEVNKLDFIDQNHYLRDGDQIKKFSFYDVKDITEENKDNDITGKKVFLEKLNIFKADLYDHNNGPINQEPNSVIINGFEVKPEFLTSRPCRDIYVRFF